MVVETTNFIYVLELKLSNNGTVMIRGERRGKPEEAEQLGISLADELLANGAREILTEVYKGEAPA